LQGHYLADSFVKKGWDVHYILEEKNSRPKTSGTNGITFHWLKQREAGSGLLNYAQLARILRRIAPDLIYQRGALDYTGMLGLIARQQKIKYVWAAASNKDCQKGKFTGSLMGHAKPMKKVITYPKLLVSDYLASYGIKHADLAVVQSQDQQKLLIEQFGKSSQIVKSGHPLPESPPHKTDVPTVLWTANIKAWKRVDHFMALAQACQDLAAEFLVIGSDRKNTIQRLRAANPTLPHFRYLGPQDVRQVEAYMSAASIFVNTSAQDYEGFPNTFIQAWMRKTPVISLHTDPDEVIRKHHLGFHSANFDQLVADVRRLLTDDVLRQRMGENAHSYATSEHSLQHTVDSLERLLLSISTTSSNEN
jgi:glycosyltransferase involved in cell wall biosynthesis